METSPRFFPEYTLREKLLEKGKLDTVTVEEGSARMLIDFAHVPVQEPGTDHRKVVVYLSGMPMDPKLTTAQVPQEVPLCASAFAFGTNDLIILKPIGCNSDAYRNESGDVSDEKVMKAAYKQLVEICTAQGIDMATAEFVVGGYSEGASQGATLAKMLLENKSTLSGFFGAEPAGISGYEDPNTAHVWPTPLNGIDRTIDLVQRRLDEYKQFQSTHSPANSLRQLNTQTPYGLHIPRDLLAGLNMREFQAPTEMNLPTNNLIHPKDTKAGALSLVRRLLGVVGIPTDRKVLKERLQIAWSKNPAYENLVEAGVPMSLFCGMNYERIDCPGVIDQVTAWRETHPNVMLATSDTVHEAPWETSSGVGVVLGILDARIAAATEGDLV